MSPVALREREGLTNALMVEAKVIQVAEDDDDMTFSAIVALSLSFFFFSFFRQCLLFFFSFVSNLQLTWA